MRAELNAIEEYDMLNEADEESVHRMLQWGYDDEKKPDKWSDTACIGYCIRAMKEVHLPKEWRSKIESQMLSVFREMTVEEAEEYWQENDDF